MPAPQKTLINLEPVASQVAEVLREWILTGHLVAGQHIRQEAIADELGVSRVPIREALLMLENEGLITRQKYRGAFVADISLNEIRETYVLRSLLEIFLFEHALNHITEEDLEYAESVNRQSNLVTSSEEWMRLNIEFHMALYEPSKLTLTMQTLKSVLLRTDRYFRLQQAVSPSVRRSSYRQHQEIIDTIRTGKKDVALEAMRQHIEINAEEVVEFVQSKLTANLSASPSTKTDRS